MLAEFPQLCMADEGESNRAKVKPASAIVAALRARVVIAKVLCCGGVGGCWCGVGGLASAAFPCAASASTTLLGFASSEGRGRVSLRAAALTSLAASSAAAAAAASAPFSLRKRVRPDRLSSGAGSGESGGEVAGSAGVTDGASGS